tara:strand:+ start:727 stop:930 length:204 start_codon:yes stop_codon:yes gene_type:complete
MAVHLGLKYGSSPSWFYELSSKEQIQVLAYERYLSEKQAPKKKTDPKLRNAVSVTSEEAAKYWLSGE